MMYTMNTKPRTSTPTSGGGSGAASPQVAKSVLNKVNLKAKQLLNNSKQQTPPPPPQQLTRQTTAATTMNKTGSSRSSVLPLSRPKFAVTNRPISVESAAKQVPLTITTTKPTQANTKTNSTSVVSSEEKADQPILPDSPDSSAPIQLERAVIHFPGHHVYHNYNNDGNNNSNHNDSFQLQSTQPIQARESKAFSIAYDDASGNIVIQGAYTRTASMKLARLQALLHKQRLRRVLALWHEVFAATEFRRFTLVRVSFKALQHHALQAKYVKARAIVSANRLHGVSVIKGVRYSNSNSKSNNAMSTRMPWPAISGNQRSEGSLFGKFLYRDRPKKISLGQLVEIVDEDTENNVESEIVKMSEDELEATLMQIMEVDLSAAYSESHSGSNTNAIDSNCNAINGANDDDLDRKVRESIDAVSSMLDDNSNNSDNPYINNNSNNNTGDSVTTPPHIEHYQQSLHAIQQILHTLSIDTTGNNNNNNNIDNANIGSPIGDGNKHASRINGNSISPLRDARYQKTPNVKAQSSPKKQQSRLSMQDLSTFSVTKSSQKSHSPVSSQRNNSDSSNRTGRLSPLQTALIYDDYHHSSISNSNANGNDSSGFFAIPEEAYRSADSPYFDSSKYSYLGEQREDDSSDNESITNVDLTASYASLLPSTPVTALMARMGGSINSMSSHAKSPLKVSFYDRSHANTPSPLPVLQPPPRPIAQSSSSTTAATKATAIADVASFVYPESFFEPMLRWHLRRHVLRWMHWSLNQQYSQYYSAKFTYSFRVTTVLTHAFFMRLRAMKTNRLVSRRQFRQQHAPAMDAVRIRWLGWQPWRQLVSRRNKSQDQLEVAVIEFCYRRVAHGFRGWRHRVMTGGTASRWRMVKAESFYTLYRQQQAMHALVAWCNKRRLARQTSSRYFNRYDTRQSKSRSKIDFLNNGTQDVIRIQRHRIQLLVARKQDSNPSSLHELPSVHSSSASAAAVASGTGKRRRKRENVKTFSPYFDVSRLTSIALSSSNYSGADILSMASSTATAELSQLFSHISPNNNNHSEHLSVMLASEHHLSQLIRRYMAMWLVMHVVRAKSSTHQAKALRRAMRYRQRGCSQAAFTQWRIWFHQEHINRSKMRSNRAQSRHMQLWRLRTIYWARLRNRVETYHVNSPMSVATVYNESACLRRGLIRWLEGTLRKAYSRDQTRGAFTGRYCQQGMRKAMYRWLEFVIERIKDRVLFTTEGGNGVSELDKLHTEHDGEGSPMPPPPQPPPLEEGGFSDHAEDYYETYETYDQFGDGGDREGEYHPRDHDAGSSRGSSPFGGHLAEDDDVDYEGLPYPDYGEDVEASFGDEYGYGLNHAVPAAAHGGERGGLEGDDNEEDHSLAYSVGGSSDNEGIVTPPPEPVEDVDLYDYESPGTPAGEPEDDQNGDIFTSSVAPHNNYQKHDNNSTFTQAFNQLVNNSNNNRPPLHFNSIKHNMPQPSVKFIDSQNGSRYDKSRHEVFLESSDDESENGDTSSRKSTAGTSHRSRTRAKHLL